jgi:hypothetical protein
MINPNPTKVSIMLSLICLIPIAASFTLIAAKSVKAEDPGGFPPKNVDHKQLTVLTGIVLSLDILFFLLP